MVIVIWFMLAWQVVLTMAILAMWNEVNQLKQKLKEIERI